ncbi:PREDICTED: programmed cell death protein 4 [Papilio polytes]|uniref:programmed cell death protein 4 n=1 Tax=Papilio polytes TaxID=76194 RepID=UPI000676A48E|nr:PREDICTED: programmed cell death protein 4 [Papilio polytes]
MEVDRIVCDSENVASDENDKSVVEGGAGDSASSHTGRIKRKHRKYGRSNSKEAVGVVSTPLPKYRSWKNCRRPRNGHGRGLPKKGGAGGKGVWGAPGCELLEEYEEDANDPNYDSEAVSNGDIEFKQVIVEADPEEVVRKSEPVILEYFEHGDTNAAAEDLLEFVTAKRSHLVCETIVEIALDHKPSHCEMASVLISDLYGRIFSAKDIAYAFERLMEKSGDLAEGMRCVRELEVPHFHHELVYETVLLAVEAINSSVEEQLCTFLAELRRCVIVTPDQMDRGFLRVLEDMSDIVLDVPLAYIMLDRFVERCQTKFRLGDDVLKRMPTRYVVAFHLSDVTGLYRVVMC